MKRTIEGKEIEVKETLQGFWKCYERIKKEHREYGSLISEIGTVLEARQTLTNVRSKFYDLMKKYNQIKKELEGIKSVGAISATINIPGMEAIVVDLADPI